MAEKKDYDLLILGGGAAGITAAIYAQRYGLKSVVIGKEFGGATAWAGEIENYPGFIGTGRALMDKFKEQAEKFGADFVIGDVDHLFKDNDTFRVELPELTLTGKAVVSGLGSEHRKLGLKKEKDFVGKGISYCATCDGFFFKGKTVMVVGGSDSAAKAIMYLSNLCKKVYVSYRKEPMRCEPVYLERINKLTNVEFIYNSKVIEILGEKKVEGVKLAPENDGGKITKEKVDIDGLFIEIGSTPITEIFRDFPIELDAAGHIKVTRESKTNIPGIYAAGDATDFPFRQTLTAASAGAIAAKSAFDYIKFGKH